MTWLQNRHLEYSFLQVSYIQATPGIHIAIRPAEFHDKVTS